MLLRDFWVLDREYREARIAEYFLDRILNWNKSLAQREIYLALYTTPMGMPHETLLPMYPTPPPSP